MAKKIFRIDLGNGDRLDLVKTSDTAFTLKDFIEEVKNSGEWYVYSDTAIQVRHIKRIQILY